MIAVNTMLRMETLSLCVCG